MIRIFKNNYDYVDFITSKKIIVGEIFCSNFIPSTFFPKDVIDYYFNKKEPLEKHKQVAEKLWKFGKSQLQMLAENKISLCFEMHSLKRMIEKGVIHEASSNFEVSLSIRIKVIDNIIKYLNKIDILMEPTPFVFRLIPPDNLILDVDRNKSEQTVQGLLIEDISAYKDFKNEFNRLVTKSHNLLSKELLSKELIDAKNYLQNGLIKKITL
ncbi:MAG: hypothetical protein PVH88_24185 [Ignavibacteria bacterium]|jgi:hypothetical protein